MQCQQCGKEFSNSKQRLKGAAKGFGIIGTLGLLAAAGGILIVSGGLAAPGIIAATGVTAGTGGAMMGGELSSKKCPHCGYTNI